MTNYVTFGGGTRYFAIFYENLGSGIYCELIDNKDGNVYVNNLGSQTNNSRNYHYGTTMTDLDPLYGFDYEESTSCGLFHFNGHWKGSHWVTGSLDRQLILSLEPRHRFLSLDVIHIGMYLQIQGSFCFTFLHSPHPEIEVLCTYESLV